MLEKYGSEEEAIIAFHKYISGKLEMKPAQRIAQVFNDLWTRLRIAVSRMMGREYAKTWENVFKSMRIGEYAKPEQTAGSVFNSQIEETKQIDAVRKQYENTDKWMKAPNGKPTNLNERQWLQVRTPAFKNWFGDWENDPTNASKVVDENGEPMVVYHGGTVENVFNKKNYTFFTSYEGTAHGYAKSGGSVGHFFVNLRYPLLFDKKGYSEVSSYLKEAMSLIQYRNELTSSERDQYDKVQRIS